MSQRMQRLADQIQRELAVLIRELKDPRLGMVTVSAVKVSKDMGYAEVYVTVLGKDLEVDYAPSLAVLNNAAGFLRGALGKSLQIRMIPRLRFHYDEVVIRGNHMAALIHQAVSADEANHPNNESSE
ncbi:30S ribosome-binding factor RbfA [uncultured Acinetobacter sp.]|uniref:30S ribosome-binding factor RbfA n=1 Tax=uncultured Acinetobacter sp. TaxID=165433 RepID=UPI002617E22A|nr:30S ribosome-binding factor RbfA [uncultured Acinetobacter sp.]